jgi:hypothetical protein
MQASRNAEFWQHEQMHDSVSATRYLQFACNGSIVSQAVTVQASNILGRYTPSSYGTEQSVRGLIVNCVCHRQHSFAVRIILSHFNGNVCQPNMTVFTPIKL